MTAARRRRSLFVRLIVPCLLVGSAMAALGTWAIFDRTHRQLSEALLRRARLVANVTAYVAEGMAREGELQRIVSSLGADDDVLVIVVAGGAPARVLASTQLAWLGQPISALPAPEVGDDLARALTTGAAHTHWNAAEHLFDLTTPLQLTQTTVAEAAPARGAIMVHLDVRPLAAATSREALEQSLAFFGALFVLCSLGYLMVHRRVLRPLAAIGGWAAARSEGSAPPVPALVDDEIGALSATLVAAHERTEAALRTAVAAGSAKAEFLANMSHEIRTPMNAVLGMTTLLLATELDADQRELAETVRRSSEALLVVLNDVLDYSKLEAGKLELDPQPFAVTELVEGTLDLFATSAADKGIDLIAEVADDLSAQVIGDGPRVGQILINLLGNAVKFTRAGEVEVSVTREPDDVLAFAVRDTGVGIAPEQLSRLFQSFTQVDASTTRRFGGTGLGLAISRRLVQLMDGEIGLDSVPGQGATAWFTFTLAVPSAGMAAAVQAPDGGAPSALDALRKLDVFGGHGVRAAGEEGRDR